MTVFCISSNAQNFNSLFQSVPSLSIDQHTTVKNYESFKLNKTILNEIVKNAPESFSISIPFEGKSLQLNLVRKTDLVTENFSIKSSINVEQDEYYTSQSKRVFYNGSISGLAKSFVALSFFENEIIGVISDTKSNIVLGAVQVKGNFTDEYMMYRESELLVENPFHCFTTDEMVESVSNVTADNTPEAQSTVNFVGAPIEIYFECDNAFFQTRGSNIDNVVNFTLGFFNGVAQLYENENIKVQVSQIKVWNTTDPYTSYNTTGTLLPVFAGNMETSNYIGDFAHFLSTRNLGGGVAYRLDNPCTSGRRFRCAVSGINNSYSTVPTYSWTVEVVTHELGHNLGSPHTQWCGWSGGAIDNCYTTEDVNGQSCGPGPQPTNGGTIMSYCHLTSTGINFNNGFGQQPGNRIRNIIANASCYTSCVMTLTTSINNGNCGQNNANATVIPTNGNGTYTYEWNNGQTTQTMTNAGSGTYYVTVKDGANCSVMAQVTLSVNSGINATLSPVSGSTVSYCSGGNVELKVTNNPAFSYQWYRNDNIIPNATNYNYLADVAGSYKVIVTGSSSCSQTYGNINVVQATGNVSANISPAGPIQVCNGTNSILSANTGIGLTYKWYNSNGIINNATNSIYNATTTGDYYVVVSAGSCSATSNTVSVNVKSTPTVTLSPNGNQSFCSNESLTITANATGSDLTYKWFVNNGEIPNATQSTYTANTSGAYRVEVSNGSCATMSTTTNLSTLPSPTVSVTPTNATIEKFETQELTATGALNYNWTFQPNLVSSTNNSAIVRPLTTTTYEIRGTAANGCRGTATSEITVIGCGKVTNIDSFVLGSNTVKFTWTNPQDVTTDSFQYRKAGTSDWTSIYTDTAMVIVTGLDRGATYEYRIIPLCNAVQNVASAVYTVNTPVSDGVEMIVMPNPANTTANVRIINSESYTLQINVYDAIGHRVISLNNENVPAGLIDKKLNTASLANGVYLVAANINGKVHTKRLIVSHN